LTNILELNIATLNGMYTQTRRSICLLQQQRRFTNNGLAKEMVCHTSR